MSMAAKAFPEDGADMTSAAVRFVYEAWCTASCQRVTRHVEGVCVECCGFPQPAVRFEAPGDPAACVLHARPKACRALHSARGPRGRRLEDQ